MPTLTLEDNFTKINSWNDILPMLSTRLSAKNHIEEATCCFELISYVHDVKKTRKRVY